MWKFQDYWEKSVVTVELYSYRSRYSSTPKETAWFTESVHATPSYAQLYFLLHHHKVPHLWASIFLLEGGDELQYMPGRTKLELNILIRVCLFIYLRDNAY